MPQTSKTSKNLVGGDRRIIWAGARLTESLERWFPALLDSRSAAPPARTVKQPAEPPVERWVNCARVGDDVGTVAHLLNVVSATVLTYAGVTRGALLFARLLQRIARSS